MISPFEKLVKGGNRIIQIVVTRSCNIFNCSNCTQLLPFRKDTQFMSLDCFRAACHSLNEWPGIVAMFGGNPCSHPEFDKLCAIMAEEIPSQRNRGLWTNDLMGKGQIAQKTFWPYGTFNLNVHGNPRAASEMAKFLPNVPVYGQTVSRHGGILLDYRDYGYTEEQWIELRNKCPINQNWSAAIYERDGKPYAYGCEVMGALDGIRKENNGIPVEHGWWRNHWDYFASQEKICVGCGVPLNTEGHYDFQKVYDISPSWQEATQEKIGNVTAEVQTTEQKKTHELTDYVGLRKPHNNA